MQRQQLVLVPLFGLTLTLGAATWLRLDEWRSELAFWRAAYETTPKTNSLPGNELGNVYYRAGLLEHALRVYRVAAETAADNPFVLGNTAIALSQLGRYAEALALFERLCAEANPGCRLLPEGRARGSERAAFRPRTPAARRSQEARSKRQSAEPESKPRFKSSRRAPTTRP